MKNIKWILDVTGTITGLGYVEKDKKFLNIPDKLANRLIKNKSAIEMKSKEISSPEKESRDDKPLTKGDK